MADAAELNTHHVSFSFLTISKWPEHYHVREGALQSEIRETEAKQGSRKDFVKF